MFLQVSSQNRLNDEEAEMLELHVVQVDQEVVFWPGHEEVPGSSSVVVLQHRAVIVQHCLWKQRGQGDGEEHLSKITTTDYSVLGEWLTEHSQGVCFPDAQNYPHSTGYCLW